MQSALVSPHEIVVATDLTDLDRLLPHAISQAKFCGARVHLVHAESGLTSDDPYSSPDNPVHLLNRAALRLQAEGIECTITIQHGPALNLVLRTIRETCSGRLLIGTHEHGNTGQQILGSVANALLRAVRVPVFVIGPQGNGCLEHAIPHRILHAVSLAGEFREQAHLACDLAQAHSAELILLHVLDPSLLNGSYIKQVLAGANARLAQLFPSSRSRRIHTVVECGDPVQEVLRIASVTQTDWIIMGIEHEFAWWAMNNSVAYQVIAECDCPVLTVHAHTPLTESVAAGWPAALPAA